MKNAGRRRAERSQRLNRLAIFGLHFIQPDLGPKFIPISWPFPAPPFLLSL